jgi:hypothetical protein
MPIEWERTKHGTQTKRKRARAADSKGKLAEYTYHCRPQNQHMPDFQGAERPPAGPGKKHERKNRMLSHIITHNHTYTRTGPALARRKAVCRSRSRCAFTSFGYARSYNLKNGSWTIQRLMPPQNEKKKREIIFFPFVSRDTLFVPSGFRPFLFSCE